MAIASSSTSFSVSAAVDSDDSDDLDLDVWPFVPQWTEIPDVFHSLELDGPFQRCLICQADLSLPSSQYMIEKIYRGSEPIVEYAMCLPCQEQAAGEMSLASMQQIQQLFAAVDYEARAGQLRPHLADGNADAWIDTCLLTGKPRSECRGFQVVTRCAGLDMELGITPLMLSDEAAKRFATVLSPETRRQMDDFMEHFGMPPEFTADPEWTPIFV